MENLTIKAVKVGNYRFELSTNFRNLPVCTLQQLMTRGKNKGNYKRIEAYYFSNEEKRKNYVEAKIEKIKRFEREEEERQNAKKEAQNNFINPYQVGEIFYDSWGYEQTNIDFYQIVEVGKKSVTLKKIAQNIVPNSEGFMSEYVTPAVNEFIGNEFKKIIKTHINYYGKIETRFGFHKYDAGERGLYQSHYA